MPTPLVPSRRLEAWPVEDELGSHGKRSPQRREGVQPCDDALDGRGILQSQHRRCPQSVRPLTGLPPPRHVAQSGEPFRGRHLGPTRTLVRAKNLLPPALLALLANTLSRAEVVLRGRNERACASFGSSIDSVHEAQFSFNDVVHEVVRDVVVEPGCGIHRASWLTRNGDDDCVTSQPGTLEGDLHGTNLAGGCGTRK